MTQVASNFVATIDSVEANQVGMQYSTINSKELLSQYSDGVRKGKGRPKKK